ncbi:MAG: HAD family hydrolase [Methanomassiliicoccales archaeon]
MSCLHYDLVALDCDGTLIDARRSYDEAIIQTVEIITAEFKGGQTKRNKGWKKAVMALRRTGYFNNDWDTACALTLLLIEAGCSEATLLKRITEFGVYGKGIHDIIEFEGRQMKNRQETYAAALEHMGYPGKPPVSRLASVFDAIYYGTDLYTLIYGAEPPLMCEGLLRREKVLVDAFFLRELTEAVGRRPILITGRPRKAAEMALGKLLNLFDLSASTFTADIGTKFEKPSPSGLLRASEITGARHVLYAGDSMEDLLMAENAARQGLTVDFVAVTGSTIGGSRNNSLFLKCGAIAAVRHVSEITQYIRGLD